MVPERRVRALLRSAKDDYRQKKRGHWLPLSQVMARNWTFKTCWDHRRKSVKDRQQEEVLKRMFLRTARKMSARSLHCRQLGTLGESLSVEYSCVNDFRSSAKVYEWAKWGAEEKKGNRVRYCHLNWVQMGIGGSWNDAGKELKKLLLMQEIR